MEGQKDNAFNHHDDLAHNDEYCNHYDTLYRPYHGGSYNERNTVSHRYLNNDHFHLYDGGSTRHDGGPYNHHCGIGRVTLNIERN